MNRWIDVKPGDWFYNNVLEATNLRMKDGSYFISGMTYTEFESDAPYIYDEFTSYEGQTVFQLSKLINPTADNPLDVFIDGVKVMYKSIDNSSGLTKVTLYSAPRTGATVSFASYGKPVIDTEGRPVNYGGGIYPSAVLPVPDGCTYIYLPYYGSTREYVYAFGGRLKRVDIPNNDVSLLSKYLGFQSDVYWINPDTATLYVPYNLNNVTCTVTFVHTNGFATVKVKPSSSRVVFNNRFFPNAKMWRCEIYTVINNLRKVFYERFTDLVAPCGIDHVVWSYLGQNVFKLNGTYPVGENKLKVYVDGNLLVCGRDYIEYDEHTVILSNPLPEGVLVYFNYSKNASTRFNDVDINAYWGRTVLELEDEKLADGTYLMDYAPAYDDYTFGPYVPMSREDMAATINRFRKWCLERFV